MKLLTEEKENKFEPFELRILVESEEDLIELWRRFCIRYSSLSDVYRSDYEIKTLHNTSSIWEFLDNKVKENNLTL